MQTQTQSRSLQLYSVLALGLDNCCLHALWHAGTLRGQTQWISDQMKEKSKEAMQALEGLDRDEQRFGIPLWSIEWPNNQERWKLARYARNLVKVVHALYDFNARSTTVTYWAFNRGVWRHARFSIWMSTQLQLRFEATKELLSKSGYSPEPSFGSSGLSPLASTQIWRNTSKSLKCHIDFFELQITITEFETTSSLNPAIQIHTTFDMDRKSGIYHWTQDDLPWEKEIISMLF